MNRFGAIYLNWWQIMRRTKVFNFFTLGSTNSRSLLFLIVGAQDYFLGTISLGVLMLINSYLLQQRADGIFLVRQLDL